MHIDANYTKARQSLICAVCDGSKEAGLLCCWGCYKKHGLRYGTPPAVQAKLDRSNDPDGVWARREAADEAFRNWLNRVDATCGYETRRDLGAVSAWRFAYDVGLSADTAISDARQARTLASIRD